MEKILRRRKSHGRRKKPKRNRCGLGWVSSVKESMGVVALGWPESPKVAFLDSEQGLDDSGLYRLDRKGLQYVRSAEERMDWYVAWTGVLM
jgi:hypothetical protein